MKNVLIFQPYLSNRKLSSNTLERQFRFLKYIGNCKVFALLDTTESDYAETLVQCGWISPIVIDLHNLKLDAVRQIQKDYNFDTVYISRTYFTPSTQEVIDNLKNMTFDKSDFRYWRNYVPIELAKMGTKIEHMIYDPLETTYEQIIDALKYKKYSSMHNVKDARIHDFADLGYYDKDKEIINKQYKFTFGGTAFSEERADLITSIYDKLNSIKYCNVFIRTDAMDNTISNDKYEELTALSMFTYTIPSQDKQYMSFTRMLLALSQGTIPLIHPDNNLDCLFAKEDSDFRSSLKDFFKELIINVDDLKELLNNGVLATKRYDELLDMWHETEYFKMLQEL